MHGPGAGLNGKPFEKPPCGEKRREGQPEPIQGAFWGASVLKGGERISFPLVIGRDGE